MKGGARTRSESCLTAGWCSKPSTTELSPHPLGYYSSDTLWTHPSTKKPCHSDLGSSTFQQQSFNNSRMPASLAPPHRGESRTKAAARAARAMHHTWAVSAQFPKHLSRAHLARYSTLLTPWPASLTTMSNACCDISFEMPPPFISVIMSWRQAEKKERDRTGRRWPRQGEGAGKSQILQAWFQTPAIQQILQRRDKSGVWD